MEPFDIKRCLVLCWVFFAGVRWWCIYVFITKAHPYHFVASSSPEIFLLQSLNQCRGMNKQVWQNMSFFIWLQIDLKAKESILALGCGFSFICACNTVRTLKRSGRRNLLVLCPFFKWLKSSADVILYRQCILWSSRPGTSQFWSLLTTLLSFMVTILGSLRSTT